MIQRLHYYKGSKHQKKFFNNKELYLYLLTLSTSSIHHCVCLLLKNNYIALCLNLQGIFIKIKCNFYGMFFISYISFIPKI